jgi:predicted CoA-substrate-specific enzyme activase
VSLVLGVDVGSTTTKLVLMEDSRVLAGEVSPTGPNCRKTASALLSAALHSSGREPSDIAFGVSTGYGRRLVDFADETVSEISANAKGATWLDIGSVPIRTIVDVGGQDSKVISLDETGRLKNFAMNDKCAAGTGRFLEVVSRILEIDLDELGEISLKSRREIEISSICTVFAESEVVSLISHGTPVEDIAAALHRSVACRVGDLASKVGLEEAVLFDGGPALNRGLIKAFEEELGISLVVPPSPQLVTALGAALIASESLSRKGPGVARKSSSPCPNSLSRET